MTRQKAAKPAQMRTWEVLTQTSHGHRRTVQVEAISHEEALAGVGNADKSITVLDASPAE